MNKKLLPARYGRSIMAILLTVAMIITTVNVSSLVADAASKPAFQKTKLQLVTGKTANLKLKALPKGAKIVKTKWTVQKKNIVQATASGKKAKKAKIKALKPGKSAVYCTVTYRIKKGSKWKTKKGKAKATVTVVSDTTTPSSDTDNPGADVSNQPVEPSPPDVTNSSDPAGTTGTPDVTNSSDPAGTTGTPDVTNSSDPAGTTGTPDVTNTSDPAGATGTPDVTNSSDPAGATGTPDVTNTSDPAATTAAPTSAPTLTWTGKMVCTVWRSEADGGSIEGSYSRETCSSGLTVTNNSCWNFTLSMSSAKWKEYNLPVMTCYTEEGDTSAGTLKVWYDNENAQTEYPYAEWNGKPITLDKTQLTTSVTIANYSPIVKIEISEGEPPETDGVKDIGSQDFSKTALEFSKDLGFGWNLGNSLDGIMSEGDYVPGNEGLNAETAWGNPGATENMIKFVKSAGFNTIRLPVTWINHTDPETYQIDEQWMDRVEEVVQYCTANGLYVILNVHHDGADDPDSNSWLGPVSSDVTAMKARYQSLWEQIADRFKDYSNLVLFASMNEFHHGYATPPQPYYDIQNELHDIFVKTVRKSGGNNAERYLIIPGYNTNIDQTIAGLKLPDDSANHLMVEVHYYDPFDFAGDDHTIEQWGSEHAGATAIGGTSKYQESYLIAQLAKMKTNYVDKGIPVVLGEFGATTRTNPENEKYRLYYLRYMAKYCAVNGLIPVYWDNGADFCLINRNTYQVADPDAVNAMMEAFNTPDYEIPIPQ